MSNRNLFKLCPQGEKLGKKCHISSLSKRVLCSNIGQDCDMTKYVRNYTCYYCYISSAIIVLRKVEIIWPKIGRHLNAIANRDLLSNNLCLINFTVSMLIYAMIHIHMTLYCLGLNENHCCYHSCKA